MSTKHIGLDVETWTFEIEKIEYLLSLCDGGASDDQVWALTSAATALCEKLRGTMGAMCAALNEVSTIEPISTTPLAHRAATVIRQ